MNSGEKGAPVLCTELIAPAAQQAELRKGAVPKVINIDAGRENEDRTKKGGKNEKFHRRRL